jgi:hypothetical protein
MTARHTRPASQGHVITRAGEPDAAVPAQASADSSHDPAVNRWPAAGPATRRSICFRGHAGHALADGPACVPSAGPAAPPDGYADWPVLTTYGA